MLAVLTEQLDHSLDLSGASGLDDRMVFGVHALSMLRRRVVERPVRVRRVPEDPSEPNQPRQLRRLEQREVESAVGRRHGHQVSVAARAVDLVGRGRERREVAIGEERHRNPCRLRLQEVTDAVDLAAGMPLTEKETHMKLNDMMPSKYLKTGDLEKDTLVNILHNIGTFEGHIRNFFMTTTNHGDFSDYYAWGLGGGLGYYSPVIKGFQIGMSGYIIYNLASSPLAPAVPFTNRYEIGLFDITNPDNHEDLDRLEDLYLRYYFSEKNKSFIQVGKFHLKTPLINLQDGRMRPNLQEGIWAEWNEYKKIKVKGGWLWRTSPRSTIHWYDIGKSLVYPNGRAVNGNKADYSDLTGNTAFLIYNMSAASILAASPHNYHHVFDLAESHIIIEPTIVE